MEEFHKSEESTCVQNQRKMAGGHTQLVYKFQWVLSVVNGSIVSTTSLIIKI